MRPKHQRCLSVAIVVIQVVAGGSVVVYILLIPVIICVSALVTLTQKILHVTKIAGYCTRAHDTAIYIYI